MAIAGVICGNWPLGALLMATVRGVRPVALEIRQATAPSGPGEMGDGMLCVQCSFGSWQHENYYKRGEIEEVPGSNADLV